MECCAKLFRWTFARNRNITLEKTLDLSPAVSDILFIYIGKNIITLKYWRMAKSCTQFVMLFPLIIKISY